MTRASPTGNNGQTLAPQQAGQPRLVLGSASPRRHELLAALGATFTVMTTDAEEAETDVPPEVLGALPTAEMPLRYHPTLLAWRKTYAVAAHALDAVVLGADTVVVIDGEVLNKPRDDAEAHLMLRRLSGRTHRVYTGLCVAGALASAITPDPDQATPYAALPEPIWLPLHHEASHAVLSTAARRPFWLDIEMSEVVFAPLTEAQITAYVATGEPRDKAGAYGLQGMGGQLIEAVYGSYTAVVGFPLAAVVRLLRGAGVTGLADATATYYAWLAHQQKGPLPWPPTLP
ncbi:nucleoside triphosphate pyrophosphatase [Candidatus Chloroploca sp. Khr17]|uniref:Maf family protein n=1 Tax=Candidatus Chloroploca sp. Khr17 TaxID=2496869 RepID=UPI001F0E6071|nr:Maf family protein [Candidatus Chloroploca sp. Khr17]